MRSTDVDTLFKPDAAAFLVASTLIYALVVKLDKGDFKLEGAVAAGTVLLAAAHAGILKAPWRRAAIAAPLTYIVWFTLSRALGQTISEGLRDSRLVNLVSIWQAAYLAFMFLVSVGPKGK